MGTEKFYIPGSWYVVDDRTGFPERNFRCRKEWTNQLVQKNRWEVRQPQDFVKGVIDDQTVPEPRPRPVDQLGGPLQTTLTIGIGYPLLLENGNPLLPPLIVEPVGITTTINVASSARVLIGDIIWVMLDNGEQFISKAIAVPSLTTITLAKAVPSKAAVGNIVTDITAQTAVNLPI